MTYLEACAVLVKAKSNKARRPHWEEGRHLSKDAGSFPTWGRDSLEANVCYVHSRRDGSAFFFPTGTDLSCDDWEVSS